jgi:hypothetical protein
MLTASWRGGGGLPHLAWAVFAAIQELGPLWVPRNAQSAVSSAAGGLRGSLPLGRAWRGPIGSNS